MSLDESASVKGIRDKIAALPEGQRAFLDNMFREAPRKLFECMVMKEYPNDTIFIREQKQADQIFILIKGAVQALEHRIFGNRYNYMRFRAVKVFGAMEVLLEIDCYKTTLSTITDCTFLVMNRRDYRRWIEADTHALLIETKMMGRYMLEQARKERLFLFLQGRERLFLLFVEEYRQLHEVHGKCVFRRTYQELSDDSGLSIRTVNRTLKAMKEQGYIHYCRGEIKINEQQYQKMQEYLEHIVAE